MKTKETKKKYYHITSKENMMNIIKNGITANDKGEIFLFENVGLTIPSERIGIETSSGSVYIKVADHIAKYQIFTDEYVMFYIHVRGIKGEIINDKVGEYTSKQQWILKQQIIPANKISVTGMFKPIGWQPVKNNNN